MAARATGISRDLIIHPGETIADILEARDMTQNELALRTGVTPVFVSKVITGQKNISGRFAMALEYALNVPKSFWLNLQARYDTEILEADEEDTITAEEKEVRHKLNDIVKYLRTIGLLEAKETAEASIISLRKLFNISSLCNLKKIPAMSAFRISAPCKTDPYVLGAWIRMCQIGEDNSGNLNLYDNEKVDEITEELKNIMLHDDEDPELPNKIKTVLKRYGIDFDIVKHFRGAPVQGFLYKRNNGGVRICMTTRGAFADIFWFSLFHEIGHLVNGDLSKPSFIEIKGSNESKERAADKFAADKLINKEDYKEFLKKYSISPTYDTIEKFAGQQNVKPYIVIGRMQKEKLLEYNMYSGAKIRYKWAE